MEGEDFEKKIGVIINGDSNEERHTGNVERACLVMRKQGFDKVYAAQDVYTQCKTNHYAGNEAGVETMLDDVAKIADEDTLVVVYGTGHGCPNCGGIALEGRDVDSRELVSYLTKIEKKGASVVGVFDMCGSGKFASDMVDYGLDGIFMSPGNGSVSTSCQNFAPYFWEYLDEGKDLNGDGKTEISEVFSAAMEQYGGKGTFVSLKK